MVIADVIIKLRRKISDTELPYSFSDTELEAEINEAVIKYNPVLILGTVPDTEIDFVVKQAWIQICYILASNTVGNSSECATTAGFARYMDELSIYNVPLSTKAIEEIYKGSSYRFLGE